MTTPKLTWEGYKDADGNWIKRMTPREVIAEEQARRIVAEQRVGWLEAALRDLLIGAEEQSQSHVDVAAKVRAALGEECHGRDD